MEPSKEIVPVAGKRKTRDEIVVYTPEYTEMIKKMYCPTCSPIQFEVFMNLCMKTGLDPIRRQICPIIRGGVLTTVVTIDGMRMMALKTGEYEGQTKPVWMDAEGAKFEAWPSTATKPPDACIIGVYRKGFREPMYGVCMFKEFFVPGNQMWQRLGAHMLSVRAESHALRKAFPEVLGGLYSKDELNAEED